MDYKTIAQDGEFTIEIKKSKFICQIKRVNTEEEGQHFIQSIKKDHYKANHSCSAMIIGQDGLLKRSSDDGEPSGTAGLPMLTVLEKLDLRNVVAVVTRYFGGVKLGTGGLIRAYSSSVSDTIKSLGTVIIKELDGIKLQLTYQQYQTFNHFLAQENLQEYDTQFLEHITTCIYTEKNKKEELITSLIEFYSGKIQYELTGSKIIEVPVSMN